MNLKTFSKDEITYNLLLLQTDGIVVAEVKDFVIRSIEKSDRSNGDIAHKIVWTEIELCYIFFTYVIFFCIRIGGFFSGHFCFRFTEKTAIFVFV
jgi:hypothetical protein